MHEPVFIQHRESLGSGKYWVEHAKLPVEVVTWTEFSTEQLAMDFCKKLGFRVLGTYCTAGGCTRHKHKEISGILLELLWNSHNAPRLEFTEKPCVSPEAVGIIKMLLRVLPNNAVHDDPSWVWSWNELSDAAQDEVIITAGKARNFLKDVESTRNSLGSQEIPCATCSVPISSSIAPSGAN